MAELAATRAEVEAAVTVDAVRVVTVEFETLCGNSTSSSIFDDGDIDDELKLASEAAREQAAQWAAVHPQGHGDGSLDGRRHTGG
jgi:hypothetical protein